MLLYLFIYFFFTRGRPLSETLFFRGARQLQKNINILKSYWYYMFYPMCVCVVSHSVFLLFIEHWQEDDIQLLCNQLGRSERRRGFLQGFSQDVLSIHQIQAVRMGV